MLPEKFCGSMSSLSCLSVRLSSFFLIFSSEIDHTIDNLLEKVCPSHFGKVNVTLNVLKSPFQQFFLNVKGYVSLTFQLIIIYHK
jgi:hypothetical protein